MDQITKLHTKIAGLEAEAAQLDPTDTSRDYYRDLYDLLSEAYFASKDINVLLQGNIPTIDDQASKASLRDAEGELQACLSSAKLDKIQIATLTDKVFKLEAWQDGANLEGEVLREAAEDFEKYKENVALQITHTANIAAGHIEDIMKERDEAYNIINNIYMLIPSIAK